MPLGGTAAATYKSILEGACDLMGKVPESLQPSQRARIRRDIQAELVFAWDFTEWNDLREYSARQYASDWDVAEAVSTAGVYRYHDAVYWVSLQATTGDTPAEGSAYWERGAPSPKLIAWTEGADTIGTPYAVWDVDPRLGGRSIKYWYMETAEGLILRADAPDTVFIEHMPPCPTISGDDWTEVGIFAVGDICYYDSAGDFFVSLEAALSGVEPGTDATKWERIVIPPKFSEFLKRAVYSRMLANDGKTALSEEQRDRALEFLIRPMGRQRNKQTNQYV